MRAARALLIAATALAVAALAVAAVASVHRHPDASLGGGDAAAIALEVASACALVAAGSSIALIRAARLTGALIAAAGFALLLGALPVPQTGGAFLFTAALAGGTSAAALAGAGALVYLRRGRVLPDGLVAAAAVAASGLWLGLLPTLAFDRRQAGCFACADNLLLVHGDAALHDDLTTSGLYAAAFACGGLALLACTRWATSAHVVRRVAAPVLVGAAAAAACAAVAFARRAGSESGAVDTTARELWLLQCAALAVVALGVLGELLRARLLSHRIAGIIVGSLPTPDALRAALAESAGDPGLAVVYPQLDGGVVDADGLPASAAPAGTVVTAVTRGRETLAQLRHAGHLEHAPERLAEAVRTASLGLEHASSRAGLRARLHELTASRTRIVEVGDAERRRLERNLHDGAQQRLIALSVALGRSTDGAPAVARARSEILVALDELRALAHGIHPAALTDAGIEAALRELADGSRVPVTLEIASLDRRSPACEGALYRTVLDAVQCAERRGDGRAVTVAVASAADDLRLRLSLPGVEAAAAAMALEHASDRVAALAGDMSVTRSGSGTAVEVRVPCAS
ncbi:MAG TPA: histidine kinase [Gaiellales bacterium]